MDSKLATLRAELLEMNSVTINSTPESINSNNQDQDDEDEFQTMTEYDIKGEENYDTLQESHTSLCAEEDEEEEEVHFPSLRSLYCTPFYGNKEMFESLCHKYEELLSGIVRMVHTSLGNDPLNLLTMCLSCR